MLKEFRDFIAKGNVMDLAVAVIMAGAFGVIVTSLIADIITPLLLNPAMQAAHVDDLAKLAWNGVKYGNFLVAILNFIVIAFVVFLLVRSLNNMMKKPEPKGPPPPLPDDVQLLKEIRDLLKRQAR